ncbi:IS110 family transposase, partial [Neisseria meningitidis]
GPKPPAPNPTRRAGIAVITATPRQTNHFPKPQPLTKPDAKDPKMLAFSAQMMTQKEVSQPIPSPPPPEVEKLWEALFNRRNQLV